jgi:hypothetical protein
LEKLVPEELEYLIKVWAYGERGMPRLVKTRLGVALVNKGLIRPEPAYYDTASPKLTPLGREYFHTLTPLEVFVICEKLGLESAYAVFRLVPLLSKEELPTVLASSYWLARYEARKKMEE